PREEVAYVTCTYRETGIDQPDFLATINLNPKSCNYGQVIHHLPMPNLKDELHSSGWSAGSTCFEDCTRARKKLILPSLISSRVYVVDVGTQSHAPRLCKMIEPVDIFWKCDKGYLNVPHALPNGDVLIANMGDPAGNGKGGFIVLDGESFELKGNWEKDCEVPPTGHDFWFQPRHNVLISSAGLVLKRAGPAFNPDDLHKGVFGRRLNVWNLSCRTLIQCFDLGEDSLPFSVRFLHNPDAAKGYVSCAMSGVIYRFFKNEARCWAVEEAIRIPPKKVRGWILPEMPGYHCSLLCLQCKRVHGGPYKMQLSLDGKRLYVTNSFCSSWDKQLYPDLVREGSVMLLIDVDTENGGLCVNKNFLVDFGKEACGPALARDIHFPCGDSTT
ncbi:SBP1 oxidase, partial [Nothocercus julius]|nr:SBP1 oxidase [Nothocercus julius]